MIDKSLAGRKLRIESSVEVIGVVGRFLVFPSFFGFLEFEKMSVPWYGDMPDEHFIESTSATNITIYKMSVYSKKIIIFFLPSIPTKIAFFWFIKNFSFW